MKKYYLRLNLLLLIVLFFSASSFAQNNKTLWTKASKERTSGEELLFRKTQPNKAEYFQLNLDGLKTVLSSAPSRKNTTINDSNVVVNFPNAQGNLEPFRVLEASIMQPELQAYHSDMRSYVGQSLENPTKTIRFSVTPKGLHTMALSSESGTELIDPYTKNSNTYIVYSKRDLPALENGFICEFEDEGLTIEEDFNVEAARNANDGMLRDYTLAIAATIEYSAFHWQAAGLLAGDSEADKKDAVMDAMIVTMTRVNGVYERELSITMTFVNNNRDIIFISGEDGLDNDNAGTLINNSQTVIDANIGSANYDIGHTFSTGGGGLAQLNSPCLAGSKARGITGLGSPVGDVYDIDFVAHEMGHQFGAPHTFNGDEGGCDGNRSATNAYEPGSGSTIMAYAGLCAPQNVQSNSDDYFHQKSLQMIWAYVSGGTGNTCPDQTSTGNTAPTANAGANYIIPISTPYMLEGSSSDGTGESIDTHTYTWEQYDLGPSGVPSETTGSGPLVRSFKGTNNPVRYIPNIPDLINSGGSTEWERLVSVTRTINFQLTVRDNDPRGGQTHADNMIVNTNASAGPFLVTSQASDVTWSQGNTETITWDVANTDIGAVNTPTVDILLSTNGGESFDTVLATGVPNNGSYDIIVPDVLEENCRVMVKGNGNIFFNINTARIAIGYNLVPGEECTTYNFQVNHDLAPNAAAFELLGGFNVPDSGIITDVNVMYDITSGNNGNLHMAMLSPLNTRAYLFAASCAGATDMDVVWDDEAGGPVVCASPTTGTATPANITPAEPLSGLDGEEMNGDWTFMAADIGNNNMTFNEVNLEICKNGYVTTVAPSRVNMSVIQVEVVNSVTILDSHLRVTSPNTAVDSDIVFTLTVLPTKGTMYLSAVALGLGDTFTQQDINDGNLTYTTTSATDDTDSFRVDTDDSNGGTLPNLLGQIEILENLSVDEFSFENSLIIYPNPNDGVFNIKLNSTSNQDINVEVFDIRGRSILNQSFSNTGRFNESINLNNVQSGMYLLNINDGDKKATRKVIIN
ncbi:reprolysin-like metallopeptidase [Lacinutrix iliipiscaria]|uniref:Reprolysin-like metallopeptidase n=1 Tax=Lacinutrix iliipiscaria TaxID=1230532 RepID=A0ABW5WJB0_9FLAO